MYTEQLRLNSAFATANQAPARSNASHTPDGETPFALLFEAALELSDRQCSAILSPDNSIGSDTDAEALLINYDSSGLSGLQYPSAMARILSQANTGQASNTWLNAFSGISGVQAVTNAAPAPLNSISSQRCVSDSSLTSNVSGAGVLNKSRLADWMDAHALTQSSHHCAMYCRMGLEAAGLNTADRPRSGDAGDYGPFLLRHGAQVVPKDSYIPQVGDVVVFDKTSEHPYGHIEMYDGHNWVSDFKQHSLSPYRDASNTPPFTIYRVT